MWSAISLKATQATWRRRRQQRYERPTYAGLLRLRQELCPIKFSAVISLDEELDGDQDSVSPGLFGPLGRNLKTTNCLESLTDKVDRWRTGDQKHCWVASALLAIEPRLCRIKGYWHLAQFQTALQRLVWMPFFSGTPDAPHEKEN